MSLGAARCLGARSFGALSTMCLGALRAPPSFGALSALSALSFVTR
jgi:hypothetical protein